VPARKPKPVPALALDSAVTYLKGCGPYLAQRLALLGIEQVGDLLFHLPTRYEDRRRVVALDDWLDGEEAVFRGRIAAAEVRMVPRRSLKLVVEDASGAATVRLFQFHPQQQQALRPGRWMQGFGAGRRARDGLVFAHPEWTVADSPDALEVADTLTPVYPATQGLTQAKLRTLVDLALEMAARTPGFIRAVPGLSGPDTLTALHALHRPAELDASAALVARQHPAQHRLIDEELLAHQVSLRWVRQQLQVRPAPAVTGVAEALQALLAGLPFAPTTAQRRVLDEIAADLAQPRPMLRLVQGDVGSGKTLVAAAAMVATARAGCQAALMAPTELLAEQHLLNFRQWLAPLGLEVTLLSGRQRKREREAALAGLHDGHIAVAVGTHALFQDDVTFRALGLIVVDEQHRFGVQQRLSLRDKGPQGQATHQLIMSATPIPRTLAQSLYADLDVSVIDELPPGRTPVKTVAMSNARRDDVLARIGEVCAAGRQAYWVCTLVEVSEQLSAQAAEETAALLRDELPHLRVGLVHGRMKADDKDAQMRAFKEGRTQLLVATTVIEVGVDVPNASIMIIENPERLGLSQLHQLRGRVGRGSVESQCVLLYQPPLSDSAQTRIAALRNSNDGFVIAQADLDLRGPGELLGRRQTGLVGMKIADPVRDADRIPALQRLADELLARQPTLAQALIRRWVGDFERYGAV
jgi:ATP-dependent DNA helicase RecG